ncbi:predicted protein [Thalassiosira pseudonana CCMP1335]|uniref:Uncharacterized protein n=1 Tax=Thalassiosira pseudonana TaxID=35128 RepID=B8CGQ4_THAPS|nr:predicted protein [Thalassiosira pseudonana CCMP1335]EED87363.1 predicted protein [Thalassiosira pseudonana CCMP1335]
MENPNSNVGEAMVVNNDAPTYTTQTETEYSSSENNISGWKALLIASTPAQQSVVNLKFLSVTVWLLTTMMVVGVVFCGVREEGVFSDFYLWMSYQVRQMVMLYAILENGATWNLNAKRSLKESDARLQTLELHLSWLRPGHCFVFTLMTPSTYSNAIWIILLALQGLFIFGSMTTFKNSPLVGYSALLKTTNNTDSTTTESTAKKYINCTAIQYPGLCASTLIMIYSFDSGYILCSLIGAVLGVTIIARIIMLQLQVLAKADVSGDDNNGVDEENNTEEQDMSHIVRGATSNPLSLPFLHEYISLRLPFELYGGYVGCLVVMYLNTWLMEMGLSPKALLVIANISIIFLLAIGGIVIWGVKQSGRHLYGVGLGMVWYLIGVAVELHSPTQPIYNEFSDSQILITQILAALASTVLSSMLALRMIKTMIKGNLFNCLGSVEDDEISTDYVHA